MNRNEVYIALFIGVLLVLLASCESSTDSVPEPQPTETSIVVDDSDDDDSAEPAEPGPVDPEPVFADPTDICEPFRGYSDSFYCLPPGQILNGTRTDVVGITEPINWLPDMRFPVQNAPAYVNSVFFRYKWHEDWDENWLGPDDTPLGAVTAGDCQKSNYQFPWQDNMCEQRGSGSECLSSGAHKGVDIRGPVCASNDASNTIVSPVNGWVITVRPHYIKILDESEDIYINIMHMDMETLTFGGSNLDLNADGDGIWVNKGDVLGRMGRVLAGSWPDTITSFTPVHLHLEFRIATVDPLTGEVASGGTPVSPYASLISAYQRLEAGAP